MVGGMGSGLYTNRDEFLTMLLIRLVVALYGFMPPALVALAAA